MSFYFSIETQANLSYRALLDHLSQMVQIAYITEEDLNDPMQDSAQLYLPFRSTRGVFVGRNKQGYEVGINVGASPEDVRLALEVAVALAQLGEGKVLPEDTDDSLHWSDFQADYGEEWVQDHQCDGLSMIRTLIERDDSILTLHGCLVPFHIGPQFLEQLLDNDPDEDTFAQRFWAAMRQLQFMDLEREGVRLPSRFQVGREPDKRWTYTVIIAEQAQVLCKTDYTIFVLGEEHTKIPYERIQAHAENQEWERLDEVQYLFPVLSEADFQLLVEELGEEALGSSSSDN